ncbi:MAG: penicillin-binding protein activator [Ghiorsea sp.]
MFKSFYPFTFISAILLSALVLTSCGGHGQRKTIHMDQQKEAELKAAKEAQVLADINAQYQVQIDTLVQQALLENPDRTSLEQLLNMSTDPTVPQQSQGQAALQYAELLFEFEQPDALQVTEQRIQKWPHHPYLPHVHNTIAQQWILLENDEAAMSELTLALQEESIDPYSLQKNITLATPLFDAVSPQSRLDWMISASRHDVEKRDFWLQQAAMVASLDYVLQLRHSDHPLSLEQINFYRYFARERLMVGDYHTVRLTAKILENDMPDTEVYDVVKAWADTQGNRITVGVLLPLTGKYAKYGQQALKGIRLAISRPDFQDSVVLRIQDTAGDAEQCIMAYHQLLSQGSGWIIGPLLSRNTKALLPFLSPKVPTISLANDINLAAESPSLFIHSLSKVVQSDFMARHAIKEGKKRAVILHGSNNSDFQEAAAFAQTFMDLGGEVLDIVELERGFSDNRPDFVTMRYHTDDEILLSELDEELFLFSPEQNMDIKIPLAFDNMYIVENGRKIALLAGQMAYSGILNVQIYGNHSWSDGHLMDDSGRYLTGAQFATPATSVEQPNQAILDVKSQYRLIWGTDNMSPLFALAYDTARNTASLGSRMGLKGHDAIDVLLQTEEFRGISGNYYFDNRGISQKTFAIQRIQNGRIETQQASQ